MKKQFIAIALCLSATLILATGCDKEEIKETETTTVAATVATTIETSEAKQQDLSTETHTQESTNASKPAAKANIRIDYASDELLNKSGAYHEFVADESEYQVKVELSTDAEVTDFQVLSLNFSDVGEDGDFTFDGEKLYSLESLTPEKPLVVTMTFAGDIPNMGISYTDSDGEKQVYSIAMSGDDGSLLLMKSNLN